jgi:chromosomal replication initiator protein
MQERSAKALWQAALGQLQLQVTRPNYETWLRDTSGLNLDDGVFTIGVPTDFIAEWLNNRLHDLIAKTLAGIVGQPLQLAFSIDGAASPEIVASAALGEPVYPAVKLPPTLVVRLNPRFTFETFLVADGNRLAHAAALAAAHDGADPSHNPLFLYSDSGLGKTHLLHAIGHELLDRGLRILYVTADQFITDYVLAARQRHMEEFRAKYRLLDALLVDDVQFLSGKERTQEEFFHTFNDLHGAGKQIVLAADQPPQTLTRFSSRLRSRFQCGLNADLTPLCLTDRLALLQAKATLLQAQIDDDALAFLARQPYVNVRELEGSLNRLLAYSRLTGQAATLDLAHDAIKAPDARIQRSAPKPDIVIDTVCSYYDVSPQALRGQTRSKRVTTARHVAMYLLRNDSYEPLTQIGRLLGDRDHSTVLYACRKIERESSAIAQTKLDLAAIRGKLPSSQAV